MPEEFVDGFDHYSDVASKWGTVSGAGAVAIDPTAGRDGRGACLSKGAYPVWTGAAATKRTVGFALKGDQFTFGWNGAQVAAFRSSGTDVAVLQWNGDSTFSILKGATALGTSTATLPADTWGYLELRYTSATAADDIALRLNGQAIIALASTNTGTGSFNQVAVGSITGALNSFRATIDDVVILDQFEGFWGDVVVEGRVPTGPGTHSDFVAVGDSPNWKCVESIDSTYVSATSPNLRDTYAFPPLLQDAQQIRTVQVAITAGREGPIPATIAPILGGDRTPVTLTGSNAMYLSRYSLNPATGLAWTGPPTEAGIKT